jgi:hypothetical protein
MVMTSVVAEGSGDAWPATSIGRRIDLWGDLPDTVDRAGGDPKRLWIDDSKAILRGGKGRERLEAACLAAFVAAGIEVPRSLAELVESIAASPPDTAELSPWFDDSEDASPWAWSVSRPAFEDLVARRPLAPTEPSWQLVAIQSVIVGPARFNAELTELGSKAEVHFKAFSELMRRIWNRVSDDAPTSVTGDKHGGRHYYFEPLSRTFCDAWIERGPERPQSSRYTIRDGDRRLELTLQPRADQDDGLVALASIVSKTVRELWMDGFNAYWCTRVPGLRRTAGYPVDAQRFRRAIECAAREAGCDPDRWWRAR